MTRLALNEPPNPVLAAANRVARGGERVVVQRRGKDLAALVSLDDLRALEEMEERAIAAAVAASWAEQGDDPPEKWEVVKARMGWK